MYKSTGSPAPARCSMLLPGLWQFRTVRVIASRRRAALDAHGCVRSEGVGLSTPTWRRALLLIPHISNATGLSACAGSVGRCDIGAATRRCSHSSRGATRLRHCLWGPSEIRLGSTYAQRAVRGRNIRKFCCTRATAAATTATSAATSTAITAAAATAGHRA
jgi:hypothetical protein